MIVETQSGANVYDEILGAAPRIRKVLVVDDDKALAGQLARALTRARYDVVMVSNSQEALYRFEQALRSEPFEVLVTDIHMPGLRRDELQRLARQMDPDIAVILLSELQDVGVAVEYLKEGVYDYITKPFDTSDVIVRIGKALQKRDLAVYRQAQRKEMERRVVEQESRIREMLQQSLDTLCNALETRGAKAQEPSRRSSAIAGALARRLCPDDADFVRMVQVAAALRDLGKIGVPDAVLNKPGRLLESEFAMIRSHPQTSEAIIGPMFSDPVLLSCIRHHHEHWNGQGYPDGLAGEEIPLGARILGVVDAFDAMISPRPYRAGQMTPEDALATLQSLAGTQMDADVVDALVALYAEGTLGALLPPVAAVSAVPHRRRVS